MGKIKTIRVRYILLAFLILIIISWVGYVIYNYIENPKASDREFNEGSKVEIENLSDFQIEELSKLSKVWGFVKYYHPEVVDGSVNWDYELFRVMPKVLEANDDKEVDMVLYDWIISIGDFKTKDIEDKTKLAISEDLQWINDKKFISKNLSELLVKLSKTNITDRKKAYANFEDGSTFVKFDNEEIYPNMRYTDEGYKLLSLFRYWNIIEYYYPYKNIIGEDWNDVLENFIPKFVECNDKQAYELTILELTSRIHDSHASNTEDTTLREQYGRFLPPLKLDVIDGKVVVVGKIRDQDSDVKIGDVITKVNDVNIDDIIKDRSKYISYSREDAKIYLLRPLLLRSHEENINLTVQRDGNEIDINTICYDSQLSNLYGATGVADKMINDKIGYLNPELLRSNTISGIMKKYKDTDGLIIDLRSYPSSGTINKIEDYLMPEENTFVRAVFSNRAIPGRFIYRDNKTGSENKDYYKGKVVILIDTFTMSHSEYSTMALQTAPNAVIVGSNSLGTDGNVVSFVLPGGIKSTISGVGIYYPDGTTPQITGIKPDVYIRPTIEGIREGKDEVLEKAISIIEEN